MKKRWYILMLRIAAMVTGSTLKDSGLLLFFVIVPTLYPLLYAYLYTGEVVHEVPVVVVDECHDSQSREFLRKSDATPDLRIVSYCNDLNEAKELIHSHKAYGMIHIPREYSKDLADGRQATVNLYCDMSGLLYYKALLGGCTHVSLSMNENIKMVRLSGLSEREKEVNVMPVQYEYVAMFNPQSGFCTFLLPAILILILQQTLVLGISLQAGTERENRMRGYDIVGHFNANPMIVLGGKTISYIFFYTLVSVYCLCIVPHIFNLIQLWHARDLIPFMIPYLLACIFFAITISFFVKERESCFLLFVFASVPILFMSGISWPSSNVPAFWKCFSYLFPSTFGINGYVRLTNTGATLLDVKHEYICLWLQAAFYFMTALVTYIILFRSDYMPDARFIRRRLVRH